MAGPAAPVLITHVTSALNPTGHIYSVAFAPSGIALASGSSDDSVRLWLLQPGAAAAMLCADSGQPLTRAEWASYIPGRIYSPPCRG
jgi:WD40 repeat protein